MISASESDEFVPYGRQYCSVHPGRSPLQIKGRAVTDHGLPIVKALKDISITQSVKKDSWKMRGSTEGEGCDEELYINDQTVVWSRGTLDGAGKVIKSFTVDSPVQDAFWCSFLLPKHTEARETVSSDQSTEEEECEVQNGVCIIESAALSIFITDGKDYESALPFNVSRTWPVKNGLLFERESTDNKKDILTTPKRDGSQPTLPVLFSMLHPLGEVSPVICKTGGSTGKTSFVTELSQQIVFTIDEPSLVITYDRILSKHTVWNLRRIKPEEAYVPCGSTQMDTNTQSSLIPPGGATPLLSHSASGFSRLTISSQSPGFSPYRNYSSRINSPSASHSRINSPSISKVTFLSRSNSPSIASLCRVHTPSPGRSPAGCPRTPLSVTASFMDTSYTEVFDLTPEVCLEHLWTETIGIPRDGVLGQASKAFLSSDLCGQQYLCYLVSYRHHLRCVKFEESNDRSQLIFGSLSIVQARDAAPLKPLNMTLVLDMNYNLILYSGVTRMNQVHVAGLPLSLNMSRAGPMLPPTVLLRSHCQPQPSTPFGSPVRLSTGPFTSSRPPSAMDGRFDEEVQMLSPVPTELSDTSEILEGSISADLSFHGSVATGSIASLRDPVDNRITVELMDGVLYRTALPNVTSSPLVQKCLEAVKQILPKDVAMAVLVRWYCTHNAPGSINGQSEWIQFTCCLLGMMGYDTNNLPLTHQPGTDSSLSPILVPKKAKPSDQGTDEDWSYMLNSEHHQLVGGTQGHMLGIVSPPTPSTPPKTPSAPPASIDIAAPLFSVMPAILYALHLVYEDLKLDMLFVHDLPNLAMLLLHLASDLRCELYVDHYCRDFPQLFNSVDMGSNRLPQEALEQIGQPVYLTREPPSIYHWLLRLLHGHHPTPFPYLPHISETTRNIIGLYLVLLKGEDLADEHTWHRHLRRVSAAGHRAPPPFEQSFTKTNSPRVDVVSPYERVVLAMVRLGVGLKNSLVFGVSLPLLEASYHCRHQPPSDWPTEAYVLIGREDLARQMREGQTGQSATLYRDMTLQCKTTRDEDDGMEYVDKELLQLRFSEDLRVQEVRRLLQSSRPVRIALTQKPEVSDHEFIEEQERHLYTICIRTMALPMGRSMFTMCTYHPVPTETVPIPKLCLTGRSPPRNTTVDLTHIDTPPNMSAWPQFHNGVAAGLRIADSSQLDSTWITYNKPKNSELTNEHAGFLTGLGLNGHLGRLATLNVHDYLLKGHDMTSVGLLLGVAAGKRGTMDVSTIRLLSIHVAALLPPTSTELDIPHNVQVAAVLSVGLVYQGTAHRHIAEVLLSEIGRPPGPEMENCNDRESYSLAAGLALGNVMLARGSEAIGLSDLSMADQLYHYMVGGHKQPLLGANRERYKSPSYQVKEGDAVNVDVTAPGATLALGMMFFKTGNSAVAEWLTAPDTQFLLEFVRPDFLMLRCIARGLVMWDHIQPTKEWITSNIPAIVQQYAFKKARYKDDPTCDIDFETMSQVWCHVTAGACMAMALRFAGSANESAFQCLLKTVHEAVSFMSKPFVLEQAGRSTVENCLIVSTLSLAMVMAGTGNLEVLRVCRYLRSRVGPSYNYVLYGSHMAVSMAMGLLFLGGGRYSLSTTPQAVAAMVTAFFPKFPIHSNDNRYHLQAFRHLYVLAAEPRVIIPRDVDTNHACYVPLLVTFKDDVMFQKKSYEFMAPCILPELPLLKEVQVLGPRYWPIKFHGDNWTNLRNILRNTGYLYVKQRAGHLSYLEDPKGYHSVLSQSLTKDQSLGKLITSADIKSFSSDPLILAFAEYLCYSTHPQEFEIQLQLSRVLCECVSQEKPEVLALHIAIEHVIRQLPLRPQPLRLWQVKIMSSFYDWLENQSLGNSMDGTPDRSQRRLVSPELLTSSAAWIHHHLTNSPGVCESLVNYLRGDVRPGGDVMSLGCLLTWHDLPHPMMLANINYSGVPSLPELYKLLEPFNLSTSAVMSILAALHTHQSQQ